MSYDSNGMRTQKSVDGVKTNYYYDSSNNLFALTQGSDTLFFYYDNSGEVMSVSCNGTMYYYIKACRAILPKLLIRTAKQSQSMPTMRGAICSPKTTAHSQSAN